MKGVLGWIFGIVSLWEEFFLGLWEGFVGLWEWFGDGVRIMLLGEVVSSFYVISIPLLKIFIPLPHPPSHKNNPPKTPKKRIKYNIRMGQIREGEQERGVPDKPQREYDEWSDCSSQQSMFNDAEFRRTGITTGKKGESAAVTELCDRIGKLVETDVVQKACFYKPESGMKYAYFGGQPQKKDDLRG